MKNVEDLMKLSKSERQSHLDLSEDCLIRGGNSTVHKGVLAQFLNTNIPSGRILLCHACNDGCCSNPKHLYWGTDKENLGDAKNAGTWTSGWQKMINKYGEETARKMQATGNKAAGGKAGKGRIHPEEHNRKISETLRNKTLEKIKLIENSNIEFHKFGWVKQVAEILQIYPQKVSFWMKAHMTKFYEEKCFKRK